MNYDKKKWIYRYDNEKRLRYILGTNGKKSLLCFGINPSKAKPENLDNTVKSVERLALNNGYDSWIMMNVYAQIATNPNDIHSKMDQSIHQLNLKHVEDIINERKVDIWAAWGTLIEKRPFLIECLIDIYKITQNLNCKWLSIGGITKFGHPRHPLYVSAKKKAEPFLMDSYIENIMKQY